MKGNKSGNASPGKAGESGQSPKDRKVQNTPTTVEKLTLKEIPSPEMKRKSSKSDGMISSPKDKGAQPPESNFVQRLKWTLIMIPSFLLVVFMGHFYVTILVIVLVCACYREALMAIRKDNLMKNAGFDYNRYLAWYEFIIFMFYSLTKTMASLTSYEMIIERYLRPEFTAFILWLIGTFC